MMVIARKFIPYEKNSYLLRATAFLQKCKIKIKLRNN